MQEFQNVEYHIHYMFSVVLPGFAQTFVRKLWRHILDKTIFSKFRFMRKKTI